MSDKPDWADEIASQMGVSCLSSLGVNTRLVRVKELKEALRKAKADGLRFAADTLELGGNNHPALAPLVADYRRHADKIEKGEA